MPFRIADCRKEERGTYVSNDGAEAGRLSRLTYGRPPTSWVPGVPHTRQKGDQSHETSTPHQKETSRWTETKGMASRLLLVTLTARPPRHAPGRLLGPQTLSFPDPRPLHALPSCFST